MANIYLAGKITKNCWRHSIVKDLSIAIDGEEGDDDYPIGNYCTDFRLPKYWPTLERSIFGIHNYTGPYFLSCDHGCYHGKDTHGTTMGRESYEDSHGWTMDPNYWSVKDRVQQFCFTAIRSSDLVFAWIDSPDCYGTIAELGYAKAAGVEICIAGPEMFNDMWFVYRLAGGFWGIYNSPKEALKSFIIQSGNVDNMSSALAMVESPIERKFLEGIYSHIPTIQPQYPVSNWLPAIKQAVNYRLDFALPEYKIAIELDGHDYHKTKEQRTRDAKRQRHLEMLGWFVIRFTGSEIYKDIQSCVEDTLSLIESKLTPEQIQELF